HDSVPHPSPKAKNGVPRIRAVSQWGMIVMALLVSCAATLILPRRHRAHA
ncbi:MAG: hypothetical protein IID43_06030, partial [Planctomycetes bacterium]|nr:hypothetical protein [Planctomycetota bacterium]